MAKQYLTNDEAAAQLGISPDEMARLRHQGKIRGIPVRGGWEFEVDDVRHLSTVMPSAAKTIEIGRPATEAPAPLASAADGVSPDRALLRRGLLSESAVITSRQIIDYLARVCRVGDAEAASVVDGFWDEVIDPEHYQARPSFVIPHFGRFVLIGTADQTNLAFNSKSIESLRRRLDERRGRAASEKWIDYLHPDATQDLSRLSVKRRMAVRIAQRTQLDLRIVHRVLWELFDIVCEVFANGKQKIRWAMRGEMYPASFNEAACYDFRCYQRLASRLPSPSPPPSPPRPQPDRLAKVRPSRSTQQQVATRTRPRSPTQSPRQTEPSGCLGLVLCGLTTGLGGLLALASLLVCNRFDLIWP